MYEQAKNKLNELLKLLVDKDGSDLHLKAGVPAYTRTNGRLIPVDNYAFTPDQVEQMAFSIMNQRQYQEYMTTHECDMSYSLPGVSRFGAIKIGMLKGLIRCR